MPRVPTYDNFTASPTGLPGARFDAPRVADAGEQLQERGQAVLSAGRAAATIATDIQTDVNRARVDEATISAERARNALQIDVAKRKGKAALDTDIQKEYSDQFAKTIGDLRNGLANDAQRRAFDTKAGVLQLDLGNKINAHIYEQQVQYDKEQQVGKASTAVESMGLNWNNPAAIAQGRNDITAATAQLYQGSPDEFVQSKTREALSIAHTGVVSAALEQKNFDYAREYLKTFNTDLTTEARGRLEKAAKAGETQVAAQEFADSAMSRGLDMSTALAEARSKFSGDMEELAVSQIKVRFNERDAAQATAIKTTTDAAWSEVMSTGRLSPSMAVTLRGVAPKEEKEILNYLDGMSRRKLLDAAGNFKGDQAAYISLRRQAMSGDPDAVFAFVNNVDMRKIAYKFTASQLETLVDLQEKLSKSDPNTLKVQSLMKRTIEQVDADLKAAFKVKGRMDDQAYQKFNDALFTRLDEEIQARRQEGKPAPTDEELRRIGREMLAPGVLRDSGFMGFGQTTVRGYELRNNPDYDGRKQVRQTFNNMPRTTQQRVAQALGGAVYDRWINNRLTAADKLAMENEYTNAYIQGRY